MTRTVIIGGHGKVALLAAPLLAEAGHDVTSIIRNPEHAAEVEA
ncbi:NAD-dependent dehydratase, partial [Micrococcus endophyticus]